MINYVRVNFRYVNDVPIYIDEYFSRSSSFEHKITAKMIDLLIASDGLFQAKLIKWNTHDDGHF